MYSSMPVQRERHTFTLMVDDSRVSASALRHRSEANLRVKV